MRFPRRLRTIPILTLAAAGAAWLPAARPASAQQSAPVIYRWIDEQGVAHYTANLDRVPRSVRGRLEAVQPEAPATPAADPAWISRDAVPSTTTAATHRSSDRTEPAPAERTTAAATRSGDRTPSTPPSGVDVASLDARIASLTDAVERDEEAIKAMLSETPTESSPGLRERDDFRTIAQRLPRLQADLRTLRDQRDRLDGR